MKNLILMKITVLRMTIEISVGAVPYSSHAINFTNHILSEVLDPVPFTSHLFFGKLELRIIGSKHVSQLIGYPYHV